MFFSKPLCPESALSSWCQLHSTSVQDKTLGHLRPIFLWHCLSNPTGDSVGSASWTYLQSRTRDTDVEKKRMDTKEGKEDWDELGDWDWHVYTTMCQITNENLGFPGGSDGKEFTCNAGDLGLTPGPGRSPEGGHGNPRQYSCLEIPHGQRSLVGCSPRGCKESDTTERPSTQWEPTV